MLTGAFSLFFLLSPGLYLIDVPGWIRWFRWLSPHFYSFRVVVISQFRDRTFACTGTSDPALRSQCIGANVLRGLRISPIQPIYPMLLGLMGFVITCMMLSLTILYLRKPSSVQYTSRVVNAVKSHVFVRADIDVVREGVDLVARDVQLAYVATKLPNLKQAKTQILTNVSATFPSGQLSVIMGPSGCGKSTFLRLCAGRMGQHSMLSSLVMSGEILFNGAAVSTRTRQICAFVEQGTFYCMVRSRCRKLTNPVIRRRPSFARPYSARDVGVYGVDQVAQYDQQEEEAG